MKHWTIMAALLLLAACGDKGAQQQQASTDVAFDTTTQTAGPRSGHSDITAIDAALDDDAKMPAEAAMPAPPSIAGPAHETAEKPVAATEDAPVSNDTIKLPIDPSVS
jgi:predicted small lipoprotein YifL